MTTPKELSHTWLRSSRSVPRLVLRPLERFLRLETGSASLLMVAAVAALVWSNTSHDSYADLWSTPITVEIVVARLRDADRDVRVLSRRDRGSADGIEYVTRDLLKDHGIEPAVDGAGTVLHLAGGPKGDDEATGNLARVASRAGVERLVSISVIGADRVPLAYFRSKLAAEHAVADSGLPFTTLRAAQFHDFVLTVAKKMAPLPVLPVPSAIRLQPVDADEVAARLVELALGEPAGRVPDLAGPRVYGMADLIRGYLRARGKRRLIVPVRLPGRIGRAYRAGENLNLDRCVGRRTWEDFLVARATSASPAAGHDVRV